jgi:hypothetical protein
LVEYVETFSRFIEDRLRNIVTNTERRTIRRTRCGDERFEKGPR